MILIFCASTNQQAGTMRYRLFHIDRLPQKNIKNGKFWYGGIICNKVIIGLIPPYQVHPFFISFWGTLNYHSMSLTQYGDDHREGEPHITNNIILPEFSRHLYP